MQAERPLFLAALGALALAVASSQADLVLDLPLDEGQGDVVADAAGGRQGTTSEASWLEGPFGAAVEFGGTGSRLVIPGDEALNPTEALTIAAWVKSYAREPKLQRIVQRASGTWGLYFSGPGATFYTSAQGEGDRWRSAAADAPLGEWMHLAGVYDGQAMRLYINGVPAGEAAQTGLLRAPPPGAPLRLGHEGGGEQTLNGALSRVRLWNEALDAQAIAAEYHAEAQRHITPSPFPPAPVLLLPFDEGRGDRAEDQSIANNRARVRGEWVEGRFGKALAAGQDGGAEVRFAETLNLQDQVTLECWARQDAATKEMQRIAFRSSAYGLYTTGDPSALTWYVMAGGEWSSVRAPMPQGRWVRITGTYDGRQLRLFFDGEEAASAPKTGVLDPNSSPLFIAHGGRPGDMPFQGAIDEVFVVGEAVTDFPERRVGAPANPESVPVRVIPYVADEAGALPSVQIGRMEAPQLDGRVERDEWAGAARLDLRDALTGQPPTDRTVVRVGYDDANIYVAYVCAESDVEGLQFVTEVTERDGPVWSDDCAEVFVQPDPAGEAYFHLSVNAAGVVYDARGQDATFNANIEAAPLLDEPGRRWSLELSVPWQDLNADGPPLGQAWRMNFCREQYPQKTLQAWSPTRSFHRRERFGHAAWAERSRSHEAGPVTVFGRITQGAEGRVASGVAVRIGDRLAMTRADGVFKLAGVPEGEAVLKVQPSPLYHPLAVSFTTTTPTTVAIPPALEEVDLQAYDFDLSATQPFRLLPLPPFEEPPLSGEAPDFPERPELSLIAARGEYEPVTFAVYAAADLPELQLAVGDLKSGGNTIPSDRVEVRAAARAMQRRWYTSPVADSIIWTRYLMEYEAQPLKAGQFRQYWLTLHVPDDAPGGDYRGTVTVTAGGQVMGLPLSAQVLPVALRQNPDKRYGAYYYGRDYEEFSELWRHELPDMRAHGCDFIIWRARIDFTLTDEGVEVSYDEVEKQIDILREHGFRPPWIVWSGLDRLTRLCEQAGKPELIEPTAARAIQGLAQLAQQKQWGKVCLTHMDEVFNEDRLSRYIELTKLIRNAGDVTVYMTIRADRPDMMKQADPFIDIRCYNGHNMDEWVSSGHSFEELAQQLEAAGDEAWIYYNPRSVDVTAEWTRVTNGLYMWLTPFKLHTPWIYNSFGGNPFDAEDGHDFGYAFPAPEDGRPVPTVQWEAFREGVDDLRYIYTLEQLVKDGGDDPKAEAAQAYLQQLRERLRGIKIKKEPSAVVKAWSEEVAPEDWADIRRELARHVEALAATP